MKKAEVSQKVTGFLLSEALNSFTEAHKDDIEGLALLWVDKDGGIQNVRWNLSNLEMLGLLEIVRRNVIEETYEDDQTT